MRTLKRITKIGQCNSRKLGSRIRVDKEAVSDVKASVVQKEKKKISLYECETSLQSSSK
jgi:hypothetical protein